MKRIKLFLGSLLITSSAIAVPTGPEISILCGLTQECSSAIVSINVYLANDVYLKARNAGNTADVNLVKLDSSDNTVVNSSASDELRLQLEDDVSRLITFTAASDAALAMKFGDAGTTATQILTVSASTTDADDDSSIIVAGGGANGGTRGASITLPGEEVSGGSDITYNAGTSDTHIFSVAGTTEVTLSDDAITYTGAAGTLGFGATSGAFGIGGTAELTLTNDQLAFSGAAAEIVPGATSFNIRNNADAATNFSIADAGAITFSSTLIGTGTSTLGWAVVAGANTACTTTCTTPCVFGVNTAATEADIVACADATADECLCAGAS